MYGITMAAVRRIIFLDQSGASFDTYTSLNFDVKTERVN